MGKYIDGSGLSHFMGILKGYFVPQTRKVNGHALSADVTITKSDVGLGSTANGAEVNQNAFSNVKVGSTTVAADSKTDTLELVAGSNVTLTPDATNDKVTIAAADTHYTASLVAGANGSTASGSNVSNPFLNIVENNNVGGSNVQLIAGSNMSVKANNGQITFASTILPYSDADAVNAVENYLYNDISAQWFFDNDKNKLDGIAAGAEVNVQSDWNQTTTTADDFIKNKPTLGAAAAKGVDTSIAAGSTSANLPTTAAVVNYMTTVAGALTYKGTVGTGGTVTDLPASHTKGWYYVVKTAGTYAGHVCEAGDMLICNTSGTTASNAHWDAIQSNIEVLSNSEIDTLWAAA